MSVYLRSKTRWWKLASVFRNDPLHRQIARIVVLFEDFKTEVTGCREEEISELDNVGSANLRMRYFFRRSILTVNEMSDALRQLNNLRDFGPIKSRFSNPHLEQWDDAIKFFRRNLDFFRDIRNDLGGHFGEKAARKALTSIERTVAQGAMEITRLDLASDSVRLTFHCSGELTARAFVWHGQGNTDKQKTEFLVKKVVEAFAHTRRAVGCIASYYLFDRFKG